jgi:hypothetical protein
MDRASHAGWAVKQSWPSPFGSRTSCLWLEPMLAATIRRLGRPKASAEGIPNGQNILCEWRKGFEFFLVLFDFLRRRQLIRLHSGYVCEVRNPTAYITESTTRFGVSQAVCSTVSSRPPIQRARKPALCEWRANTEAKSLLVVCSQPSRKRRKRQT